jgi:hypothetical protein
LIADGAQSAELLTIFIVTKSSHALCHSSVASAQLCGLIIGEKEASELEAQQIIGLGE